RQECRPTRELPDRSARRFVPHLNRAVFGHRGQRCAVGRQDALNSLVCPSCLERQILPGLYVQQHHIGAPVDGATPTPQAIEPLEETASCWLVMTPHKQCAAVYGGLRTIAGGTRNAGGLMRRGACCSLVARRIPEFHAARPGRPVVSRG